MIEQANRGVKYPKLDLSGWSKVSSKGNKFISLSAKKPWEKSGGGGYSRDDRRDDNRGGGQQRRDDFDLNDEIPF